jgi:competence protein ComFC
MLLPDSLLSVIYPQSCHLCACSVEKHSDGVVCFECWRQTRIFDGSEALCDKCSAYLSEEKRFDGAVFCRRCDDYHFDRARAAGIYEGALYASIIDLKVRPFIPQRLEELIYTAFLASPFVKTTRIVPVPLSLRRQKERGFNQAAVIAKSLGKKINVSVDELSLARKLHTERHRAGMDRKARQETVKNAFEIKRPRLIRGENILLVDDIFTSGATVSNCAKTLKKAGAVEVNVLTIARAK